MKIEQIQILLIEKITQIEDEKLRSFLKKMLKNQDIDWIKLKKTFLNSFPEYQKKNNES